MSDVMCSTVASTPDEMERHYRHEGEHFTFSLGDDYADFNIHILADEEKEVHTIVGFFPVKIPKAHLDKTYKVINNLNIKTIVGYFASDSDDGELSFRLANNVDGGEQYSFTFGEESKPCA